MPGYLLLNQFGQEVTKVRVGENCLGNAQPSGHLQFFLHGAWVVKQHEVGIARP